jgi:ribonuclease-3
MIHPSYAYEANTGQDNERLEFLGDAVLGLTIAHLLYEAHPDADEGSLTRQRAFLVRKETLAQIARRLGIHERLLVGKSVRRDGGRGEESVLADALEAVVGALYLRKGFLATRRFIQALWREELGRAPEAAMESEAKSLLQEAAQRKGLALRYETVRTSGPAHDRRFEVVVRIGSEVLGRGVGASKKAAETAAAQEALKALAPSESAQEAGHDREHGGRRRTELDGGVKRV